MSVNSSSPWHSSILTPMTTSCGMVILAPSQEATGCAVPVCSIPSQTTAAGLQNMVSLQQQPLHIPSLQLPQQQQQQQQHLLQQQKQQDEEPNLPSSNSQPLPQMQFAQQQVQMLLQQQKFLLQAQQQQQQQQQQPMPATLLGAFDCNASKENSRNPMGLSLDNCNAQLDVAAVDLKSSSNSSANSGSMRQSNRNNGGMPSRESTSYTSSKLNSFAGSDGSSSSTPPSSVRGSGQQRSQIGHEKNNKKSKAGTGKLQQSLAVPRQQRLANSIDVEDAFATELWEKLATGGQAIEQVAATLSAPGMLRRLTFEPVGCRTVQAALDAVPTVVAAQLAGGLKGSVLDAIYSRHGNYVVQKIIKVVPAEHCSFVAQEIKEAGPVATVACHEYGCRILCRLLEHTATHQTTIELVDSCLEVVDTMVCHTYGHHVVEAVLDHGLPKQQAVVLKCLMENSVRITSNRSGAFVVQKALSVANDENRALLAARWLDSTAEEVAAMVSTPAGQGVFKLLLAHNAMAQAQVMDFFQQDIVQQSLLQTKHGRGLLEAVGLVQPAAAV